MLFITAVLISTISLPTNGVAPVLRTAKLKYEIQQDVYRLNEEMNSCTSNSKNIKKGSANVPVYDLTNGGGFRSERTPIEIELENPETHAPEKVVLNLSTVIANLKTRKFYSSNVTAEDPATAKSFRTQGFEIYTDKLNTKFIEGWIGVSTPELKFGEACEGRGFSMWVSFEDTVKKPKR